MFINENMTLSEISEKLGIGTSGIRYLLQRESINTGKNKLRRKVDINLLKKRYFDLMKINNRKMKVYEILSNEFGLSVGYISKIKI
jgi:hypothetical protein